VIPHSSPASSAFRCSCYHFKRASRKSVAELQLCSSVALSVVICDLFSRDHHRPVRGETLFLNALVASPGLLGLLKSAKVC
jgi:hypothetical protein